MLGLRAAIKIDGNLEVSGTLGKGSEFCLTET
jgi:hypothetical protein